MKIPENKFRFSKLLLIILTFFLFNKGYSQTYTQFNFLSPENILNFADHLFCEEDYLRAIDEYKRYPVFENNDTIIFKIAISYSKIGKHYEAISFYKKLLPKHQYSDEACIGIAKLYFLNKDFTNLQSILTDSLYYKRQIYTSVERLNKLSLLYVDKIDHNNNIIDLSSSFPKANHETIIDFYKRKINPPYKNPVVAGVLSGLIPGLGKIYTGYNGDGVTAFLLTGVLSYTSYSNFKAGHNFRAWLFAGLGGIFYLGNIYGSAVSAQIYNTQVELKFKVELDNFLSKNNYFLPNEKSFCK